MYSCFGNISGIHYLAHIHISRIFSEHGFGNIRCCWAAAAAFIFQVKIASSKTHKPIADGSNSRNTILVNGTNLVYDIICAITFFSKHITYRKCFL